VWRAVKEKTRQAGYFFAGKSDTEKLVFEATNDDPWGPANNQMMEIARLSMNWTELENVKKALWERMGDTDEVRHVQKALLLLEYLLRNGNESIRNDSRMMLGQLQSLTSLQMHETGEEAALEAVIRKKSADIIQMINDNDIYQMEREKAKKLSGAVTAVSGGGMGSFGGGYGSSFDSGYGGGNSYGSSSYGNSNYGGSGFNDSYSSTTKKPEPQPEEEDEELEFDPRQGVAAPAPAPAAQGGFDPFGAPAAAPQQQNTFDPFGAPAPAKPAAPAPAFDLFGAPAPARPAAPAAAFDPFGAPAPAQQAQNTFNAFGAPAPAPQQQAQNTFNAFGAPAPAPQQQNTFNAFGAPAQPQRPAQPAASFDFLDLSAPAQPQRPQGIIQQQQMNASMGFGQPMGQPMGQQPQQARQNKPVDNFGGLVDLDLRGSHKGYGKAQQPRGNGPTLGGF
jgi:hypothetical protein